MKYLSLFSGIGGFEVAIHRIFPNAQCIGYSEVKPHAIDIYEHHFPDHKNLGDITKISNSTIKQVTKNGCDLVVAGFPCTNLSSMANIRGKYFILSLITKTLSYTILISDLILLQRTKYQKYFTHFFYRDKKYMKILDHQKDFD